MAMLTWSAECAMPRTGMDPVHIHGHGAVAQLVERVVRNDEVWGSIPHSSTTSPSC